MKKDFDFIKDKLEASGVKAPEHMDERYVLDRIEKVQPQPASAASDAPAPDELRPRRRAGRVTAIAAGFVAVAVLGTAVTVHLTRQKAQPAIALPAVVDQTSGLIRFSSRDEVLAAIEKVNEQYNNYRFYEDEARAEDNQSAAAPGVQADGASANGSKGVSSAGAGEGHSDTYQQVEGVDEADWIKTDGRYIYAVESSYSEKDYSDTSCIAIFPARPGVSDPILRLVPGEDHSKPAAASTADEATPDQPAPSPSAGTMTGVPCAINDLFLSGDRLIVICDEYAVGDDGDYYYYGASMTRAYVYDVADMPNVKLLDSFAQSGEYTSSRMIGDVLYLVTNEYDVTAIPACGRGGASDELPADCIYSIEEPSLSAFLIVSAYDVRDYSAATDTKAVLGLGSDIYCSEENLYIAASEGGWYAMRYGVAEVDGDGAVVSDSPADDYEPVKTKIFKVSLSDGVSFTAYGEVEGYTNNQYSFDENNGYLRVATTSTGRDYEDVNNLYVLDGNLELVGSVTGFAETESIKAVRYVGDTAYVITYEQTDPLFVIDLSSPSAPAILGEVKISGFSTMLVPIDGNTVLGLGYNTGEYDYTSMEVQDGFKLALFDVSDKSSPAVLDSRAYVNYSSEVMYNPKALVYNPDRGDYIIPLNYYFYDQSDLDYDRINDDFDWQSYHSAHTEQYGAVLNFRVEGGSIVETELHRTGYDCVGRCVYVGDTVYVTYSAENGELHLDSFSYR